MTKHSPRDSVGKFSHFIGKSCGILYLTAVLLAVTEVILRYVFESPSAWNLEIVMALCGTAWLLSVGAVTQQQRHITVTVMELVVGQRVWRKMQKLAIVISIVAVLGLAWSAWEPALHSFSYLERSGSAFNPPLPSYLKVLLLVACFLYLIQLLANLFTTQHYVEGE
ncbi:TRAP transporter small permease [Vibrio sp. CK2-1]|uniref:TRAP transporter small permease subunit n=1 Tax=Vibrio sp. CK2-1 TaxID=2912249 RepID=UPI001F32298C|nr:TRAP transporter small permease [Vibrio sp. CK2-1]MCF7353162.1 TRAP transporter small permease [Vibrio sp. CK2-1]